MRDLRFRAWDTKDKIMWLPLTFNEIIKNDWELCSVDMEYCLPFNDYVRFAHPDTVWMQYTGLKDKNGKEIYEGDIIKGYSNHHKEWQFKEVVWDGCGWGAKPTLGITLFNTEKIEVVGNIHENAELIKV